MYTIVKCRTQLQWKKVLSECAKLRLAGKFRKLIKVSQTQLLNMSFELRVQQERVRFESLMRHYTASEFQCAATFERKCKASFGTVVEVVAFSYVRLQDLFGAAYFNAKSRKHLLWAYSFLKLYLTEDAFAARFRCDTKTWNKVIHKFVPMLARLDTVRN
jgi:hypothetical protein